MGTIGPVTAHDHGQRRNDFCLSDRDGTTSSREFMDVIAGAMRALGYSVSYNDPFKGAESVRLHGNPAGGVHSVQIEVIPGRHGSERVTADAPSGIGAPLRRREDLRFLTGRGRYVADLRGTGSSGPASSGLRTRTPGCAGSTWRRPWPCRALPPPLQTAPCTPPASAASRPAGS